MRCLDSSGFIFNDLSSKRAKVKIPCHRHCIFLYILLANRLIAHYVMVAMLVIWNNEIFLLWELTSIIMQTMSAIFFCLDRQHGGHAIHLLLSSHRLFSMVNNYSECTNEIGSVIVCL